MNCPDFKELFPDYLTGQLPSQSVQDLKAHLSECESCRVELHEMASTWTALGKLPDEEPGPALRGRFYAMLESEKRSLERTVKPSLAERVDGWMRSWWPRRPALQFGLTLVVLIAGLGIGSKFRQAAPPPNGEMAQLRGEFQEMQQLVSLSMLKQNSSSERLRAVSLSTEIDKPTPALLNALTNTLNSDSNINVRLAAVDALMLFSDQPGVLDQLILSLAHQESPLVQVALIDLLIGIQEKKSLQALKNLIQTQDVDPEVKKHAEDKMKDLT
jgi:hypothetical protein